MQTEKVNISMHIAKETLDLSLPTDHLFKTLIRQRVCFNKWWSTSSEKTSPWIIMHAPLGIFFRLHIVTEASSCFDDFYLIAIMLMFIFSMWIDPYNSYTSIHHLSTKSRDVLDW